MTLTDAGPDRDRDREIVGRQLGRTPRAMRAIGHRCPCGNPDVVETAPRLVDGTPFPTLYYLTCPRVNGEVSRLESAGVMKTMSARLHDDEALAQTYRQAHEQYLRTREGIEHVEEIAGISAGGMPNRVKCLHVLVAHSLAVGPGVNPLGDEALTMLAPWWTEGPCV